jgi:hypothetical protein
LDKGAVGAYKRPSSQATRNAMGRDDDRQYP